MVRISRPSGLTPPRQAATSSEVSVSDVVEGIERVQAAREHLAAADFGPVLHGASAFTSPQLSDAERRSRLSSAAGDPLTDSVLELLSALTTLTPEGALAAATERADAELRPGGELRAELREAWFAPFLEGDLGELGGDLEILREAVGKPGFRQRLDSALDIVRVAGRVEAHNLERIAMSLPPDKRGDAERIVRDLAVRSIGLAVETISKAPGDEGAQSVAFAAALSKLIDAQRSEGPEGALATRAAIAQLAAVVSKASDPSRELNGIMVRASRLPGSAPRALSAALGKLTDEAMVELRGIGLTTAPGTEEALGELTEDLRATSLTMVQLARMSGAVANPNMARADRIATIKTSAEDMGPIFVKLLQTIANQEVILNPVLDQYAGGPAGAALVMAALQQLQTNVTPMPFEDVRTQLESQLGKPIEEAFVKFEKEPLGSASIGQVHLAEIEVPGSRGSSAAPRTTRVAVKVQRLNLEEEFDKTARVARLSVDILRELLRSVGQGALGPRLAGQDTAALERLLSSIDGTLGGFIDSFRVEMDYRDEAKNMNDFRHESRLQRHVVAPRVYDELSTEKVLTQKFMAGYPLPDLLERYEAASKAAPVPTGELPRGAPGVAEAERRGVLFAEANVGGKPRSVEVEQTQKGFKVQMHFDDKVTPRVAILIKHSGKIERLNSFPDLSRKSIEALRDRMISSFVSQALVYGILHGDLHQGNFLVMKDAKTLALIDFGNVVRLGRPHLKAVGQLGYALWRGEAGPLANAMLRLSKEDHTLSGPVREDATRRLTALVETALKEHDGRIDSDAFLELLTLATVQVGLEIDPVYLQSVKTTVAMLGSVESFAQHGIGFDHVFGSSASIAGNVAAEAAAPLNPFRARVAQMKDEHEDAL